MEKVSVIIPTYNCAEYLSKAVSSVLAQTYPNIEIIVVDDGSTDNTREIVSVFQSGNLRYFYKENGGPGSARNYALKKAGGEIITFLDADDYYAPNNIEIKVKTLIENQPVTWLFSDVYFVTTEGAPICIGSEYFKAAYLSDYFRDRKIFSALLEGGNFISTATIMMKRECFNTIGLFDESQLLHQDYWQWLNLAYSFPDYIYMDAPLAYMTRRCQRECNNIPKMGIKSVPPRIVDML